MKAIATKYFRLELDKIKDFDLLYKLSLQTKDSFKKSTYRSFLKNLPLDKIYISISHNPFDSTYEKVVLLYFAPLIKHSCIKSLSKEDIEDFFTIYELLNISLTEWLKTK